MGLRRSCCCSATDLSVRKSNGSVPSCSEATNRHCSWQDRPDCVRMNGEPVVDGGQEQPLGDIARMDMSSGEAAATEAASRDFRRERSLQQTTMIDAGWM